LIDNGRSGRPIGVPPTLSDEADYNSYSIYLRDSTLEKDLNGDGVPDYVWYGGDDTGQRLLWFLSKEKQYECINVFKTAEAAWKKKFGGTAPDLGEVFGNDQVDGAIWDGQLLTVTVVVGTWSKIRLTR
jgi:hypothetical protein